MNQAYRVIAVLQILLVLALILLTLLVFFPLQRQLSAQVLVLRNEILNVLEQSLGNNISFRSIHPSIFSYIEIRDLRLYDENDTTIATIDRLIFRYDIREVLRGEPLSAPRFVEIRGGSVHLDAMSSADEVQSSSSGNINPDDLSGIIQSFSDDLTVTLRNLRIMYEQEEPFIRLQSLVSNGELYYNGSEIELSLQNISSFSSLNGDFLSEMGEINTSSRVQGQIVLGDTNSFEQLFNSSAFQLTIATGAIESQRFTIQPLNFYFQLADEMLTVRTLGGSDPFVFELIYDRELESAGLSLNASEWTPSTIVRLKNVDPQYNRLLASVISTGMTTTMQQDLSISQAQGWIQTTGWLPVIESLSQSDIQFSYANEVLQLEQFSLSSDAGDSLDLRGQFALSDNSLDIRGRVVNNQIASLPPFSTDIDLQLRNSVVHTSLQSLMISGLDFQTTDVQVDFNNALINAVIDTGLLGSEGQVHAEAQLLPGGSSGIESLQVSAEVLDQPLGEAVLAAGILSGTDSPVLPDDLNSSLISASLLFAMLDSDDDPEISLDTEYLRVRNAQTDENILQLSLNYKNGQLNMPLFEVNYLDQSFQARGSGNLTQGNRYTFDISSSLNEYNYDASIVYFRSRNLWGIRGSYNSQLSLRFDSENLGLQYRIGAMPLPALGQSATLASSGSIMVNLEDYGLSDFQIDQLAISNALLFPLENSQTGSISTVIQGILAEGLTFEGLSYQDFISSINGSARLSLSDDNAIQFNGNLTNQAEDISFVLETDLQSVSGTLNASRFPVRRFGSSDLIGLVDVSSSIRGTIENPELAFSVESRDTRFAGDPISFTIPGSLVSNNLAVNNADIELTSAAYQNFTIQADLGSGQLRTEGSIAFADAQGEKTPSQYLEGQVALPELPVFLSGEQRINEAQLSDFWTGLEGSLTLTSLDQLQAEPQTWDIRLEEQDSILAIYGGPNRSTDSLEAQLFADGSLTVDLSSSLPVSFHGTGFIDGSSIDLNLIDMNIQLGELGVNNTAETFIALRGGQAEGSLRITGPIVDPDFYGTLTVNSMVSGLEIIPGDQFIDSAFIIFEGRDIFLPDTTLTAGSDGVATLSGSFSMSRWLPDTMVLNVETVVDSLPIAYDFSSVVIDGYAGADLEIGVDFSGNSVWVVGSATANAMGITLSDIQEADTEESSDMQMFIDLSIQTGRGVEFYWPARNFPILRSSAVSGDQIHLVYQTPPDSFALTGDVGLRGGEVFYFDQNFYIRQGEISFNETLNRFDPQLSVNAELRSSDGEGPLRVYLEIEQDHLTQLQPRFTSVPSRSESDIVSLLTGQIVGGGDDKQLGITDAVLSGSEILGQVGVFREIENEVRDRLSLDLFSLRTGLFQNFIQDVIVTPGSEYPLNNNRPITLGRYLQNSTMLMGRYVGNDVFMELMVQLQEQNPVYRSTNDFIGIAVEAEVSLDWATPYFDLNWTLDFEHPETLFVTDHTLTFTRNFSRLSQ